MIYLKTFNFENYRHNIVHITFCVFLMYHITINYVCKIQFLHLGYWCQL